MSKLISVPRGDTPTLKFTVTSNSVAVDITGAALIFSVKKNHEDTSYLFQRKNVAAGGSATQIEMSDPTNGIFYVILAGADTENLLGEYVYDVEMTLSTVVTTLVADLFNVSWTVTR